MVSGIISILATTMALLAVGGSPKLPDYRDQKTPMGHLKQEVTYNEYRIRIFLSYDGEGSLIILSGSRKVYEQEGYKFFVGGKASVNHEVRDAPSIGRDITGNGKPNVVIYEWSGGVHCCYSAIVFEIAESCVRLDIIDGRHGVPEFKDLDGDSVPEVLVYDWSFSYWPNSFFTSPSPQVILRWTSSGYQISPDLMWRKEPRPEEINSFTTSIRKSPEWGWSYGSLDIPKELFSYALNLMYSGHENLGWRFIRQAWTSQYPFDDQLLDDLRKRLSRSPYWGVVRAFQRKRGVGPKK